jgi:hypothetical protein
MLGLGLLAWDIGRRWLDTSRANDVHRQCLNAVSADVARLTDEHGERIDDLRGKYGDLGTAHNLSVRTLQERADDALHRICKLEQAPALEPVEPPDITTYKKALENLVRETRDELARRPTHEDLKAAETRLHGVLSGAVAKGASRFA